jgi:phosphoglycerate dehydrogenase-like enzyme
MPNVLITIEAMLNKSTPGEAVLREAGFDIAFAKTTDLNRGVCSQAETIEQLFDFDSVIVGGEDFSRPVITSLPRLRVMARCGVGYDRVDIAAATELGIPVTITPTANYDCVAEHTFSLVFAVAKSTVTLDRATRAGEWTRQQTMPLRQSTLGIVGLGRIGRAVAVRARALGMNVMAAETNPDTEFVRQHGIELVSLNDLLANSDFLTLHCPLNSETQGLMNRERIAKMKPGAVLINTARGGLVVEQALIEALESGHLRAAGLDVFEVEPAAADNPLMRLDNVVVSPHLGGADTLSMERMGVEAAQSIVDLHRGHWPEGAVVNDSLRDSWQWSRER